MPYRQIPQELNDEIIECLWNDKAALKACALTCQSFLPTSQKYLFSVISLFPSQCRDVDARPTFSNFRRVLDAAPYLSEYVHSLEIKEFSSSRPCQTAVCHDQDLISCLHYLRNLKALRVRCPQGRFDAQRWEDIRRSGLLKALLETMKLPTLSCLDFDCLPFSLVNHCPTLKHLTLRMPDPDPAVDDTKSSAAYVYPESLCIDLREASDTCRKFDRRPGWVEELRECHIDLADLKTLSIVTNAREWEEHCRAWPVLKASAATLKMLKFEVEASSGMFFVKTPFNACPVIENPLDWSSLKALQILQAQITVISAHDQWGLGFCDLLPWLSGLLRALTSSGSSDIEELVLQVNYQFLDEQMVPVILPWKSLLSQLSQQARFPRLRKIDITIGSESAVFAQSTFIVQQILKYAQATHDVCRQQVVVSLSRSCGSSKPFSTSIDHYMGEAGVLADWLWIG